MKSIIKLSLRKTPIEFVFLQIILLLFTLGCEESLPTREEEEIKLIETEFSTVDGRTALQFTRERNVPHPHNPTDLRLSLRFINTYTETLQGFADSIDGYLDVWLREEPAFGKRYSISKNTEVQPIGAPSRIDDRFLTLDPGDTFFMEIHWAHESENGVKMWNHFGLADSQSIKVTVNAVA